MRQIFLDKGSIIIKEVAQPLLEDSTILVSVCYSFMNPEEESFTLHKTNTKKPLISVIPEKIAHLLESLAAQGLDGAQMALKKEMNGSIEAMSYSCSGKVIAIGKKVKNIRVGDLVACAGVGFAFHADVIAIPENLVARINDEKFLQESSIITTGITALQALRRTHVQIGETICIVGLNLLGHILAQLALLSGCNVITIDPDENNCRIANNYGVAQAFKGTKSSFNEEIQNATAHQGADYTFITHKTPSQEILNRATEITRTNGSIVIMSDSQVTLNQPSHAHKELNIILSHSYGPGHHDSKYEVDGLDYPYSYIRWTENRNIKAFVELIEQGKIVTKNIIPNVIQINETDKLQRLVQDKKSLGFIIQYAPKYVASIPQKLEPKSPLLFKPATKDSIRIGLVGSGKFAQANLLPLISKLKSTSISAIVDKNITTSINTSRLYGAAHVLANDDELFTQDIVDAVIIASPYQLHFEQTLKALQQGKAVFSEKPMVANQAELNELIAFLRKNPQAPFCVDYNRSFAPFIRKTKYALEDRKTPVMIHYRMNAGHTPKKNWGQNQEGAGRIIDEACHIFDLFAYLTDAKPVAVSVEALRTSRDDLFPTDNFSAHISYSDGSVCSLFYTALGHQELGKEYMELYFDSKSIVMNDYKTLKGYGLPNSFDAMARKPDKGHECIINTFFAALQEPVYHNPISIDRLESVAQLTLTIDRLAIQGGGVQELI